jgi:hypothetical protein
MALADTKDVYSVLVAELVRVTRQSELNDGVRGFMIENVTWPCSLGGNKVLVCASAVTGKALSKICEKVLYHYCIPEAEHT